MGTNKYFNFYQPPTEKNLIEDLNREAIAMYGIDVVYLPRTLQKLDLIFGEDVLSKFDDYYDIEMYIKNIDRFEGQGDIFTKFGLEIKDQATFTVSRQKFDEVVGAELPRPREGDLIYLGMTGAIYEIRFVEHKSVFWQLGDYYIYDLICEQHNYAHQDIDTGINEIDELETQAAYRIFLGLGPGTGTYVEDEKVFQGNSVIDSTATATLVQFLNPAGSLEIKEIRGAFTIGNGPIIGATSGASYELIRINEQDIINDKSASNIDIEFEGDNTIDFSEDNPFSENDF